MSSAPDVVTDRLQSPTKPPREEREWTPGFSDGLGDRFLDFDQASAVSLERLRFKQEFSEWPGFEAALRQRVDQLKHLQHPSIAAVRAVDRHRKEGLILESKHTAGRRLSELFPQARGAVFALELIRHLTPVLALLHKSGEGVAHGALTAERIVATRDGRLVMVEHVVGSALAAMRMPATRIRAELGLALPAGGGVVALDARGDLVQLGFLALSLLLGRRLSPSDYPANVDTLLAEYAQSDAARSPDAPRLQLWLERALQVGPRPFGSAQDAHDAFGELPTSLEPPSAAAPERSLRSTPAPLAPAPVTPAAAPAPPTPVPFHASEASEKAHAAATAAAAAPVSSPVARAFVAVKPAPPVATPAPTMFTPAPAPTPVMAAPVAAVSIHVPAVSAPVVQPATATAPAVPAPAVQAVTIARSSGISRWIAIGLGAAVIAEGAVIAVLMLARPENVVIDLQKPAFGAALERPLPPPVLDLGAAPQKPVTEPAPATTRAPEPVASGVPASERFGGVRVSSAIELQVFENGRLVGSTAGPIALQEGSHAVDLANDALGYRVHQTVVVKAGQLTPLSVPVPNGRISINAAPWAEVTIDGKAAGQTPLANLTVPIGEHEIIFRHPQFAEQRQTVVVKAEGLTRVSATLK